MKNIILSVLLAVGLCGCATNPYKGKEAIRVGITPNYPPMIFNQDGNPAGLEYDMMLKLGKELQRPITVVSIPWEEQIDDLVAGKIDIIMSGMSITQARKVRIGFTDSWMKSGLMAMMRRANAGDVTKPEDVLGFRGNVGVVAGTTAHDFVRRSCPDARVVKIASASDAAIQLGRNTIDLFIHDIPSIAWQVSSSEADLAALMKPLNREEIAWGVRRDDTEFTAEVNQALQKWQDDGSLKATILKWIPYYEQIK